MSTEKSDYNLDESAWSYAYSVNEPYELNDFKFAFEDGYNAGIKNAELALNLAQAEIRAMYKRLNIKDSNVLSIIDETLNQILKNKTNNHST